MEMVNLANENSSKMGLDGMAQLHSLKLCSFFYWVWAGSFFHSLVGGEGVVLALRAMLLDI